MTARAMPQRLRRYFALRDERPDLFVQSAGGIVIELDPEVIRRTEAFMARKLAARGVAPGGARVGVILDDPYFLVLRDAVTFPDGSPGTYARIVMKGQGGAAVLPVHDGKILMLRIHRHAVRKWLWEIPRGGIEAGKTPLDTARNELFEEIGGRATDIQPLGYCFGSTATSFTGVYLFQANVSEIGVPQVSEGITGIRAFTTAECEAAIRAGDILDSFTLAAFLQAKLAGTLPA